MDENKKYTIIKKLVETNGSKKRSALELNCTHRHINRPDLWTIIIKII